MRLVDQVGGATGESLLPPELPLDEPVPNSRPKKPEIAPKKSNMGEPFARTNAVTNKWPTCGGVQRSSVDTDGEGVGRRPTAG